MSKIGNVPVQVPDSVEVKIEKNTITVKGQEGEIFYQLPKELNLEREGNNLVLKRLKEEKYTKSLHGLYRQLIFNAIRGVSQPWQRRLKVVGTGYNVKMQGEDLLFKLGFSHPVVFKKSPKIKFQTEGNDKVIVLGPDKQLVGQVAYLIRMIKPPDPYKGKGIRYEGEKIKLKPGKKVKAAGAA